MLWYRKTSIILLNCTSRIFFVFHNWFACCNWLSHFNPIFQLSCLGNTPTTPLGSHTLHTQLSRKFQLLFLTSIAIGNRQSAIGKSSSTRYTKNWRATRGVARAARAACAALAQFVVNWIYSFSWPCPLPHSPLVCPLMIALRLWQLHFRFLIAFGTSWLDDNGQRVSQRLPPCPATKDTRNYWNCFAISLDSPPSHGATLPSSWSVLCVDAIAALVCDYRTGIFSFWVIRSICGFWLLIFKRHVKCQCLLAEPPPPSLSLLLRHLLACKYLLVSLSVRIRVVFELLISC